MKKLRHRVLFRYSSHQIDTGSPKALLAIIDLLKDSHYEACYLATGKGPLIDQLLKRKIEISFGDVEELSIKSPVFMLKRIMYWRKRLRELDISLLHMNEFGWSQDVVISAWSLGIPVILHCHNPSAISPNNLNRFAAKKILTVSKNQLNAMENVSLIRDRCDVLHNTLDPNKFASGHSIRESLGISDKNIVIGTIAQICHRKGVDIFIETAKKLFRTNNNLHFLIIGPTGKGEEEFAQALYLSIKDNELKHNIHFLGSRSDIPNLLASMDIFFLPTRAEPFGMVVTEAMAAGLPVVASMVGGIPEIINSKEIGVLVKEINAESFSREIQTILNSDDVGRGIGKKGQESLISRFDCSTIRKKLVGIYDDLLGIK